MKKKIVIIKLYDYTPYILRYRELNYTRNISLFDLLIDLSMRVKGCNIEVR